MMECRDVLYLLKLHTARLVYKYLDNKNVMT